MENSTNKIKGEAFLNQYHEGHTGGKVMERIKKLSPYLYDITINTILGGVMQDKTLDTKTRELTIIATLIAQNTTLQARAHIEAALACGATKQEIIALIVQCGFYCGFPKCVNVLLEVEDILG